MSLFPKKKKVEYLFKENIGMPEVWQQYIDTLLGELGKTS